MGKLVITPHTPPPSLAVTRTKKVNNNNHNPAVLFVNITEC